MYEEQLSSSRSGVSLTKKELRTLDAVVRPLILQRQSPYMILASHPELGISVKTLYNYIDTGLLLTRNADLKRKVKFKKRKCHGTQITNREIFVGRTYRDFRKSHSDEMEFWEMDTVLSAGDLHKCILTLYLPRLELLWAHIIDRCTQGSEIRIRKTAGSAWGSRCILLCFSCHSYRQGERVWESRSSGTRCFRGTPYQHFLLRPYAQ